MRELKFRAWANGYGKWCHSIEYMGDGLWLGYVDDGIGELSTTDIIVEQYTGLKDKNGKEIYEGDILRLYDRFISQITWRETPVAFSWFANDGDGNCGLSKENEEYYEVIGNIHENPELAEKQKKRYGLEDFVKGRVDDETIDRIAHKADELQRENLNEEDKELADKAAKLIARDYGEVIKKLEDE